MEVKVVLTGIIVGGIMVVIMAVIMGGKDGINRIHIENLQNEIKFRDITLDQQHAKVNDMQDILNRLAQNSAELVYDYSIIADLLYNAIGEEQADKLYNERKAQQPTDLNELIKSVSETREKHGNY